MNNSDFKSYISEATRRNWDRLSKTGELKLTARANKKMSNKQIVPVEYLINQKSIGVVESIVAFIKDNSYSVEDAIFTLAVKMLKEKNIFEKENVQSVLSEYDYKILHDLISIELPTKEIDLLGAIYQTYLNEGKKNMGGVYYTPHDVVKNMTKDLDFSDGQTFFDPCCGSGAYFMALNCENPTQIYGMDNDPVAVFIAKVNLLIKFQNFNFIPQIVCCNYLDDSAYALSNSFLTLKFDYVVTNPPWGACSTLIPNIPEITSKESFSLFYVKAYKQLKKNGKIRFLLPESVLNVKTHKDLRYFVLNNGRLKQITHYDSRFAGVTTRFVDILQTNKTFKNKNYNILVVKNGKKTRIPVETFFYTNNLVFNSLEQKDVEILKSVKALCPNYLSDSIWALGIVTGDNSGKLLPTATSNAEPIFTGKEVSPYKLTQPKNYIVYNRDDFQQVAKDEFYRAEEKLVYKFISSKLVFAYDNTGALVLNSANVLIPKVPNMSIKSVMAFLNSELYQYLYVALFSEIKILKGNLMELPLPNLTKEQDELLTNMVDEVIANEKSKEQLDNIVCGLLNITEEQNRHIKNFLKKYV